MMETIYDVLPTLAPIRNIIEIGCSRMIDTEKLRNLFPSADIYCFEPDPRTLAEVLDSGIWVKLDVVLYPFALSDVDGTVDFYLSTIHPKEAGEPDHTDSSSLRRPSSFDGTDANKWLKFVETPIKVESRRLDSFGLWPVDFIWMDAQSAEDLIIKGGPKTFRQTRYLYTEHCTDGDYVYEPGLGGIKKLLPGWTVERIWPVDVLLKNPNCDYEPGMG